ncbi:MAG: glycosyltransferase family 4 protein [Solirubrobacteraceae bacterium MAG38_C4-C5]|nr:glycosyltransferase family 4 protein [Candidatus Siliceabacter maunaloa]
MRVAVDATHARRGPGGPFSGTGVYLQRLIPALRRLGVEVVELAQTGRRPPGGGGLRSVRNLLADAAWTQQELPRLAAHAGADVLHHPLPARSRFRGLAQVVTVHDLAFAALPWAFDPAFRRWAARAHRSAARGADAVVTPSQATCDDVVARWAISAAQVVVARHGPGQEPDATRGPLSPAHFLYVGDTEPRKNLGLLLEGYARYRAATRADGGTPALPLVLAGSATAAGAGITVEHRPDAQRLARLYAGAAALVHPALHEGFGLTPLEAMSAGTPVVAVHSAAVAEVCDDAALYVGPHAADDLAGHLQTLAADASVRADLRLRGRRRAAEFSWARCARAHQRAYTLALRRRTERRVG